jgi:hypothetical protein
VKLLQGFPARFTADAIVIAVAERFRAVNIATLDRRHFSAVRPSSADSPRFRLTRWKPLRLGSPTL